MIHVNVRERDAVAHATEPITSGSVGLEVSFRFSEDWENLGKTAVFRGSGESVDVEMLTSDSCAVPWEVLQSAGGHLKIGVYGTGSQGQRVTPTIWADAGEIREGAEPSEIEPTPATQSLVQQLLEAAQAARDAADAAEALAQSVRDDADAGAFDGEDGYSPSASVSKSGKVLTISITDKAGTTTKSVTDGEDGDDGKSAYAIAVENGFVGTEEEWLQSLHGEDATVDATLSQPGEAADAAETGKVKAMADRHDAELLAITPVSGSADYTWTVGTSWSKAGTNTSNSLSARSAKKEVSPGTVIVNASSASVNGKTLYIHVAEWNGSTFVDRSTIRPGGFVTIGATTDTYALNFGFDNNQSAPNMDAETLAANFGVRVVTKPSGGGGGTSDYDDLTNKPSIENVPLSGNKTASDLGLAKASDIPAAATANPSDLGTAAPGSSAKFAREDHVHNAPGADEVKWTGDPLGGQTAPQDVESAVERVYDAIPTKTSDLQNDSGFLTQHQDISGKLDKNRGVAHAGEFCVVGSDGNITTVTMTAWSGGSY